MKLLDITPFTDKSGLKIQFSNVYVSSDDDHTTYVATDSFRLIQVRTHKLPIADGYYSPQEWKNICKLKHITKIEPQFELNDNYPDYAFLFPENPQDLELTIAEVNPQYLVDSIKILNKHSKKNLLWLKEFKQHENKKMIYLENESMGVRVRIAIMGLNL